MTNSLYAVRVTQELAVACCENLEFGGGRSSRVVTATRRRGQQVSVRASFFGIGGKGNKAAAEGGKGGKGCSKCKGKGSMECQGCKGSGKNKKNGNMFERWKCYDCQGFGLVSCPNCGSGGLTPEQRGER
jgi:hypothetical protein